MIELCRRKIAKQLNWRISMRLIIEATTDAATSPSFRVMPGTVMPVIAKGLAGAEEAQIQVSNGDGTFSDVWESTAVLSATAPQRSISAHGDYRVVKDATVGASSIAIGD
jgi:hypothetical protein